MCLGAGRRERFLRFSTPAQRILKKRGEASLVLAAGDPVGEGVRRAGNDPARFWFLSGGKKTLRLNRRADHIQGVLNHQKGARAEGGNRAFRGNGPRVSR